MAYVAARRDIHTSKGLCIAHKGEQGEALKGATPYDPAHIGKVLVRFKNRSRAYWCDPRDIAFPADTDRSCYLSKPVETMAEVGAALPSASAGSRYDFGANLRLCRQARQMTQTELGSGMRKHGLNAAQATICYRESKAYSPNGRFVDAAARVLKVPAWVFFIDIKDRRVFDTTKRFLMQLSSSVCNSEVDHVGRVP